MEGVSGEAKRVRAAEARRNLATRRELRRKRWQRRQRLGPVVAVVKAASLASLEMVVAALSPLPRLACRAFSARTLAPTMLDPVDAVTTTSAAVDAVTTTFEPRGITTEDTIVFVLGCVPFVWAGVEFWRRIAVGDPFGTGSDSVFINDTSGNRTRAVRRVLGADAIFAARVLFAIAGVSLASVVVAALPLFNQ